MADIISETIRKLPPELWKIIYKKYLTMKIRQLTMRSVSVNVLI